MAQEETLNGLPPGKAEPGIGIFPGPRGIQRRNRTLEVAGGLARRDEGQGLHEKSHG